MTSIYIVAKESRKKAGAYLDIGEAGLNRITGYRQELVDNDLFENKLELINYVFWYEF